MRSLYRLRRNRSSSTSSPPKITLLKAGRILDVKNGSYSNNQGILIEGEKIEQVGSFDAIRASAPKDATFIDLGNAIVLPVLIDCHAHLLDLVHAVVEAADQLILTITKLTTAKRALLGAANGREDLEAGFTTTSATPALTVMWLSATPSFPDG